jgi:hypothetical protein
MKKLNRWPLGITVIYVLFVLIMVAMVIFSRHEQINLVTKDYYEQELKYQLQIDRIERAKSLSNPIRWLYDKDKKLIKIQFPDIPEPELINGNILFFRPSDAQQDKQIALKLSSDGSQIVSTKHLAPGYWKLKIFWQSDQTDYYDEGPLVIQ